MPQKPTVSGDNRVLSFGLEQNFEKFKVNKTLDEQIQDSSELDKLIEKQDRDSRPPKITIGNETQEKIPEPKFSNGSSIQVLVEELNNEIQAAGSSKKQSKSNVNEEYVNKLLENIG